MSAGHIQIIKGLCYILAQIVGAQRRCLQRPAVTLAVCSLLLTPFTRLCIHLGACCHLIATGTAEVLKVICVHVLPAGAIFASLLIAGLVPTSYIGMGNGGTGCFGGVSSDISNGAELLKRP
jgi:hypothetical protein